MSPNPYSIRRTGRGGMGGGGDYAWQNEEVITVLEGRVIHRHYGTVVPMQPVETAMERGLQG